MSLEKAEEGRSLQKSDNPLCYCYAFRGQGIFAGSYDNQKIITSLPQQQEFWKKKKKKTNETAAAALGPRKKQGQQPGRLTLRRAPAARPRRTARTPCSRAARGPRPAAASRGAPRPRQPARPRPAGPWRRPLPPGREGGPPSAPDLPGGAGG